jgi:hypothetical protein
MKKIIFTCVAAGFFLLCFSCFAAEPSLTIYNQNFAVVREQLPINLKKGTNEIKFNDITMHLEPDSVILRDPKAKRDIQILEQNYRADPISQGLLLSLYEGKEIEFLTTEKEGQEKKIKGKIIRSGYIPRQVSPQRYGQYATQSGMYYPANYDDSGQPIIEVDGKLRFSLPGQPLFPSLTDDTILKPTLNWLIRTDTAGKLDAELSYVTSGMMWEADYSMLAPTKGDNLDMIGWVTMDNQTGRTFENAKIKLMAGDVSKIQQNQPYPNQRGDYSLMVQEEAQQPTVSEKTFEEYHLYTLNNSTTLRDRQTKQVEFVRANDINSKTIYVYDGVRIDRNYYGYSMQSIRQNQEYGTQSNPKVWVMREFKNSKENNLGIPLPKGVLRFYRQDDDGQLEFVGENTIDHTPKDEKVRVYTGNAFDLVGERIRTDFQTSSNWADETFQIKVRNHKEKDIVEFRVVEHLYRWVNWEIVQKSDDFEKTDSKTIEFRVQVPAGQEKTINYKVHYTW